MTLYPLLDYYYHHYYTYNTLKSLYHTMTTSKFMEILEPTEAPSITTHPHLNVSLEDILAEEGRKRSASQSSESSQAGSPDSGSGSGNESLKSPTEESKASAFRRRALTLGSRKGRRAT